LAQRPGADVRVMMSAAQDGAAVVAGLPVGTAGWLAEAVRKLVDEARGAQ
jgi:hypothetical protein